MKKSLLLPLVACFAVLLAMSVPAAAQPRTPRSTPRPSTSSNQTYIVIQIGDDYKVIESSRLKDEEKDVKKKYQDEMKRWADEKKTDPKAERPKKVTIKKYPTTFKTQEGAQKYRDQLLEKNDKGGKADKGGLPKHGG
jgi:hypothetical protein